MVLPAAALTTCALLPRSQAPAAALSLLNPRLRIARRGPLRTAPSRCFSAAGGEIQHERQYFARPSEITRKMELANTVHLIGTVGMHVKIKHLSSGKVVAWTSLGVKKSATDTIWINLALRDEMAHVAFHYVEKGQQIHVCGRLKSDTVEGYQEKKQVYYEVVVKELHFIQKNLQSVSPNDSDVKSVTTFSSSGSQGGNRDSSVEKIWQAFFASPLEWWDNRNNKKNPKSPDFKHKDTGEALWVDSKYNPPWVRSQLTVLDSRMGSMRANGRYSLSPMYVDDVTTF